jgi:hypothetical protein
METKVLGIGIIALVIAALFTVAPVSAWEHPLDYVAPMTGDFDGDGDIDPSDWWCLYCVGRGYTDSRHKDIPCTWILYDNPDVNQDGKFSRADTYLYFSYMEWEFLGYTDPNPYEVYPDTWHWTSYPVYPHYNYYHCNLVGNDCRYTTVSGLRCHTGTPWPLLTGPFTA